MDTKIVVTNRAFPETLERLAAVGRVVANTADDPWPRQRLLAELADADAVMAFMPDRVDAAVLAAAPRLRVVACALKGFDNFDVEACTRAGVWVTVVGDLLTVPTAELAIGLMIAAGRFLLPGDRHVRSGRFDGWRPALYGTGLAGSAVGLLGMGAIGRAIAERLSPFGATVRYWDRSRLPADAERALAVEAVELDALLATSDFVVSALPLTPETRHLVGRDAIARMRPGALLVNPSRGSVVDEIAVADALASGRLGAYAADVFAMEDWALEDRPRDVPAALLAQTDRTVFTPHLGSAVTATRRAIEREAADSIADALAGRAPRGAVNQPVTGRPATDRPAGAARC
ncbi:phosphonate dehydrogenase [Azospirillum sp. A39]|uniref:phosphonate dehydrogenase n=1 Tax=Azospirillum sp. A39 TaxID=3462279 RepID=UPI0040464616